MNQSDKCPECGAAIPASGPRGLCPACLLKRGLETNTIGYTAEDAPTARWTPPTIEELATRFPELEITRLIGRGGMGAVYLARQKSLDRIVALKILPPEMGQDPAFAQRFATEAQAMAKLNHPHIVTIYEFGRQAGWYYFVMEYVDGLSLRGLLDSGHVSPKEALAIVPQICDALQYAHEQGIVHRDIKPENILLSKQGQVKIADFGLAKLMGRTMPAASGTTEKVMGTPQYMAPEQLDRPADVDHRADIYSLGVVFYQMLTGELPTGQFAPPSKKVQIDVRLDEVVLRALEREPEKRYQHASEVRTQIETIAETSAGPAPQPTTPSPPTGVNINVELEWKRRGGKPPLAWRFEKVVPIVGVRSGKRVIYVPGVLARTMISTAFVLLGLLLVYTLVRAITGHWIPGFESWLIGFPIPIVISRVIQTVVKSYRKPLDQLPSLEGASGWSIVDPTRKRYYIGRAFLWIARIVGSVWVLTFILSRFGLSVPPFYHQTAYTNWQLFAQLVIAVGLIAGWFSTRAAVMLTIAGWVALVVVVNQGALLSVWPVDCAVSIGTLYLVARWLLSPPDLSRTIGAIIAVVCINAAILIPAIGQNYPRPSHMTWSQTEINDVQPDGSIRTQMTSETGNLTGSTWKTFEFVSSDFYHIEKLADVHGRPIPFTVQHDNENHIYRYKLTLPEPVPPGQTFTISSEGTMDSLVQPTGEPGVFEYHMNHWPCIDGDTLRTEVHRLPTGAQLLEKSPSDLVESQQDGRIELRINRIIPPKGNLEIRYRYRLAPAATQPEAE